MTENTPGPIILIGGHEEKEGERAILRAVAHELNGRKLVLATVASHQPEGYFDSYREAFAGLGDIELVEIYVNNRVEAHDEAKLAVFDDAGGVFFSGGDQLRISSQIGETPIEAKVREVWERGGVLAGTSAGAAVMSDTMLIQGTGASSHRIGDLGMAPGLGLVRDVVIDQHFAERGRFGRLLGAVAHSPRVLGIGIDEDTAVIVRGQSCEVVGSGAVYIIDGEGITHSSIAEESVDKPVSLYDVRMHVLTSGDMLDLSTRRPVIQKEEGP